MAQNYTADFCLHENKLYVVAVNHERTIFTVYQLKFETKTKVIIEQMEVIKNKVKFDDSNIRMYIVDNHIFFMKNGQELQKVSIVDFTIIYDLMIDENNLRNYNWSD